jgi:hypothetical protein
VNVNVRGCGGSQSHGLGDECYLHSAMPCIAFIAAPLDLYVPIILYFDVSGVWVMTIHLPLARSAAR